MTKKYKQDWKDYIRFKASPRLKELIKKTQKLTDQTASELIRSAVLEYCISLPDRMRRAKLWDPKDEKKLAQIEAEKELNEREKDEAEEVMTKFKNAKRIASGMRSGEYIYSVYAKGKDDAPEEFEVQELHELGILEEVQKITADKS